MRIALYLRFSSSSQQETSIEAQQRECEAYCNRFGYDIVKVYIDREKSAYKNIEKRTSFLEMINDSDYHIFDGVLVYSLDRFSRNKFETALYEKKLNDNKIKLLSVVEPIDDTPQGFITKEMFQMWAEYYSKELSQKVKRGMLQAQIDHNTTGGVCPLGYKIVNKQYVVDENTKDIVIEIFERISKGTPIKTLIDDFKERGVKTSVGKPFGYNSFHRILTNKKYIGIYSYLDKDKNLVEDKDESMRIISDELYYSVQEAMKGMRKIRKNKNEFLLSSKLFCKCGHKMYGENPTSRNGKTHYYYFCQDCGLRIERDDIENDVLDCLSDCLTDEKIEELGTLLYEFAKSEYENGSYSILEKKLKDTEQEYKEFLLNLKNIKMDDVVKKVITEYQENIEQLKQDLFIAKVNCKLYPKEEYTSFLRDVLDKSNSDNKEYGKTLVSSLVQKIVVKDNNECDLYLKTIKKEPHKAVLETTQWWAWCKNTRTICLYI